MFRRWRRWRARRRRRSAIDRFVRCDDSSGARRCLAPLDLILFHIQTSVLLRVRYVELVLLALVPVHNLIIIRSLPPFLLFT
jgi:hypothetical protein